jgi:hypothetical protein
MRNYCPASLPAAGLLVGAVLAASTVARPDSDTVSDDRPGSRWPAVTAGVTLLAFEYIAGPIIARRAWWEAGFDWGNPFANIGENEPYLEDNAWHLAACDMLTEFHYRVLRRGLGLDDPVAVSCGLTFVTYTAIECFDALERSGRWRFSIGDEVANCLGIGFWLLKHYFPATPLDVRVGVRRWGDVFELAASAPYVFRDYREYVRRKGQLDLYSVLKVEAICRIHRGLYMGVALSKRDDSRHDLWGVTVGYDIWRELAEAKRAWWNAPFRLLSRYAALSMAFTVWLDR